MLEYLATWLFLIISGMNAIFLSNMAAYLRIDRYLSRTRLEEITWLCDVSASLLSIRYMSSITRPENHFVIAMFDKPFKVFTAY